MYCYSCAAQNADDAKYCRTCGANLELITRVLRGRTLHAKVGSAKEDETPTTTEEWLLKRGKGMSNIIAGVIMPLASLLMLLFSYLFIHDEDWFIIWAVFFGWIFFGGARLLAKGIGAVLETNTVLRGLNAGVKTPGSTSALPPADYLHADSAARERPVPVSVTESTTSLLDERARR